MHNEVFVDIPGCRSDDKWCDYDKFLSLFNPNVTSCDFSKICDIVDFNEVCKSKEVNNLKTNLY